MSTETVIRTAPDPEALQAFAESVVVDFKGHQVALMASLGDHLGLFTALAEGPATSTTVASRAGLDERHVREWLAGMTAAEYVCHDPDDDTYHLTPEQAAVFARGRHPGLDGRAVPRTGGDVGCVRGDQAVLQHR